jgi:hypothetical protein
LTLAANFSSFFLSVFHVDVVMWQVAHNLVVTQRLCEDALASGVAPGHVLDAALLDDLLQQAASQVFGPSFVPKLADCDRFAADAGRVCGQLDRPGCVQLQCGATVTSGMFPCVALVFTRVSLVFLSFFHMTHLQQGRNVEALVSLQPLTAQLETIGSFWVAISSSPVANLWPQTKARALLSRFCLSSFVCRHRRCKCPSFYHSFTFLHVLLPRLTEVSPYCIFWKRLWPVLLLLFFIFFSSSFSTQPRPCRTAAKDGGLPTIASHVPYYHARLLFASHSVRAGRAELKLAQVQAQGGGAQALPAWLLKVDYEARRSHLAKVLLHLPVGFIWRW